MTKINYDHAITWLQTRAGALLWTGLIKFFVKNSLGLKGSSKESKAILRYKVFHPAFFWKACAKTLRCLSDEGASSQSRLKTLRILEKFYEALIFAPLLIKQKWKEKLKLQTDLHYFYKKKLK